AIPPTWPTTFPAAEVAEAASSGTLKASDRVDVHKSWGTARSRSDREDGGQAVVGFIEEWNADEGVAGRVTAKSGTLILQSVIIPFNGPARVDVLSEDDSAPRAALSVDEFVAEQDGGVPWERAVFVDDTSWNCRTRRVARGDESRHPHPFGAPKQIVHPDVGAAAAGIAECAAASPTAAAVAATVILGEDTLEQRSLGIVIVDVLCVIMTGVSVRIFGGLARAGRGDSCRAPG